eukprot:12900888-Prorocentrum_lima.AAC.1
MEEGSTTVVRKWAIKVVRADQTPATLHGALSGSACRWQLGSLPRLPWTASDGQMGRALRDWLDLYGQRLSQRSRDAL